jgi:hypothetical protein
MMTDALTPKYRFEYSTSRPTMTPPTTVPSTESSPPRMTTGKTRMAKPCSSMP